LLTACSYCLSELAGESNPCVQAFKAGLQQHRRAPALPLHTAKPAAQRIRQDPNWTSEAVPWTRMYQCVRTAFKVRRQLRLLHCWEKF